MKKIEQKKARSQIATFEYYKDFTTLPICDTLCHELNLPHYFINSWRTASRIGMNVSKNTSQGNVLFFQFITHCVMNRETMK